MNIIETEFNNLYLIENPIHTDDRGVFFKPFEWSTIANNLEGFQPKEIYYSVNHKHVIRGMHFQMPPMDHTKLVWVSKGSVLDVVLDIRKDSSRYGNWYTRELSSDEGVALLIPRGFAHGFLSLEEGSIVNYAQTSEYCREADNGILYNSFGFSWPEDSPIVSMRDKLFQQFCDYNPEFV
jgi:dTDP-4-dehydrorhamnose 3,5-epimerase/CDP-3, 6-dideoxy-D-glycero-D-glycero-4-hexulose-5-epimerase